ncbi:ankyrin repeat domain-containing protein [Legionella fallonii]|uniref:Uncharacterized protein n=1 Tax=Legionella fallonii LLAP-10 TaxID=1212491 RepID=A0A098G2C4_9GAMM|nr:ankyrin repeat domain-containing protein [Legionella fallonii]CEG56119.1 protein of unknown function [ankyrin repeat] [Legionella fallonii LLAP-10]
MPVSFSVIQECMEHVKTIRQLLNQSSPHSNTEVLVQFENQLTLAEIELCFSTSSPDKLCANLAILLANRWERIRHSTASYTRQPFNKVNQLCLTLAHLVSPLPKNREDYDKLRQGEGPYFVIMPSLKAYETVYYDNIHQLKLHEFVLSDDEQIFIPIEECLNYAIESNSGELTHLVSTTDRYPKLSPSELDRVIHHFPQVANYYKVIDSFNQKRLHDSNFGAQLAKLTSALRAGGVHGSGEEYDPAAVANEGISEFAEYWNSFPEEKKQWYYDEYLNLKDTLGRLMRPTETQYHNIRYCIELVANHLDPIIEQFKATEFAIVRLREQIVAQQQAVREKMKSADFSILLDESKLTQPRVLRQIFQLNAEQQTELFKYTSTENALRYALEYEPLALPEYIDLLGDDAKKDMIVARFKSNESALIIAAKQGAKMSISLLLQYGADIAARDVNESNALHWAANNGHSEVVRYLLEHHAEIELEEHHGDTALNLAVIHGNSSAVAVLLEYDANLDARNFNGNNSLDLAIKLQPELIEQLLLKAIMLSPEAQRSLLREINGGVYPNVLFYAEEHCPQSFNSLAAVLKKQNNLSLIKNMLCAKSRYGKTALIAAAAVGSLEAVQTFWQLGADIKERDFNNRTALHWGAYKGEPQIVEFLVEQGSDIEAQDEKKNTALLIAVMQGKQSVVDSLLAHDADVTIRNARGENALDLAIRQRKSQLIETLLLKAVTLSSAEQKSFLSRVDGGIYDNVFIYAMCKYPDLLPSLLNQVNKMAEYQAHQIELSNYLNIDAHLDVFSSKRYNMKIKQQRNEHYISAVEAVDVLISKLTLAKAEFLFQEGVSWDLRKSVLKQKSIDAVTDARPVLEQYREWQKVIAAFFIILLTLPVSLPLIVFGFFPVHTQSAQALNKLEKEINSLPILST